MKTITFYSYKGGVGRSLLVANAARYLALLGKRVLALDFDLEAPGLHYKFELGKTSDVVPDVVPGFVDILTMFLRDGEFPADLSSYTTTVESAEREGPIRLMGAGRAPNGQYWEALSALNWHDLFYGEDAVGVPFFMELKQRIEQEFEPDFLLIDARTGITEMGGVATTLLSDIVVCVALATREHLEGLRAVMRGIKLSVLNDLGRGGRIIVPVVSRLVAQDSEVEAAELERVRLFLNEPLSSSLGQLDCSDIGVLHSEPILDAGERLLVGSGGSPHDLPLLRDYLRLFSRIIPSEDIRPRVGQLVLREVARLLDDPDGVQSNLEALAASCADEVALRALLKVYLLRKSPIEKIVSTAALMWDVGVPSSDPIFWEIIQLAFGEPRATDVQKKYVEFGERVWRAFGGKDAKVALVLASTWYAQRSERAIGILREYVERIESPHAGVLARLLDYLRAFSMEEDALVLVSRFKATLAEAPEFLVAWGRLVYDMRSASAAKQLLEAEPLFSQAVVRARDPVLLYRLRKLAGEGDMESVLLELAELGVTEKTPSRLREIGEIFQEEGRWTEFERMMNSRLPARAVDEIRDLVQRRVRGHRAFF